MLPVCEVCSLSGNAENLFILQQKPNIQTLLTVISKTTVEFSALFLIFWEFKKTTLFI